MSRSRFGSCSAWCAWRLLPWPLLAVATIAQAEPQQPPPEPPTPAELRACTVLKLASYLTPETPPPRSDPKVPPYRIGLLGKDDVTVTATRLLPGKVVGGTTASVVTIETLAAIEGKAAQACDLLYVAASIDGKVLERVIAVHADQPMPIVCERPGFVAAGGAVQLFVEDQDLRFEVNVEALKAQGIKASPHLLKLSRKGPIR